MPDAIIGAIAKVTLLPFYTHKLNAFMRSLQSSRSIQQRALLQRIRHSADTQFGREHGLTAIRNLQDFRRSVPIVTYEAIAPYVAKELRGETGALLPTSERILALACTTGSTAAPKVLPLTQTWLQEYRTAWELWGAKAIIDHVDIIGTRWLQLTGPAHVLTAENGMPIGMLSAATARFQNPILKTFYVTPFETGDIASAQDRNYTILRLAMAARVGIIMTITPANLIRLAEVGDENRDSLIRDLHDGTLRGDIALEPEYRERIDGSICVRHPARARELEKIIDRTGRLYPKDYWPLKLISCWLGGTVGYQSKRLADFYGSVSVRDLGLISTEGRHTIPLSDHTPEGVLNPHAAYYEFAVAGDTGERRSTFEAHELEIGGNYAPIISTSNGLYRYDLEDVVRCAGFIGQSPVLEFLHKTEQYSDLEGEKITAYQIVQAVETACRQLDLPIDAFTALPTRIAPQPAYYGILTEQSEALRDDVTARKFLALVDRRLAAMNVMYSQKRRDCSIGAPRLLLLSQGSWLRYADIAGRKWGTGDTQHKHPALLREGAWPEGTNLVQEMRID